MPRSFCCHYSNVIYTIMDYILFWYNDATNQTMKNGRSNRCMGRKDTGHSSWYRTGSCLVGYRDKDRSIVDVSAAKQKEMISLVNTERMKNPNKWTKPLPKQNHQSNPTMYVCMYVCMVIVIIYYSGLFWCMVMIMIAFWNFMLVYSSRWCMNAWIKNEEYDRQRPGDPYCCYCCNWVIRLDDNSAIKLLVGQHSTVVPITNGSISTSISIITH